MVNADLKDNLNLGNGIENSVVLTGVNTEPKISINLLAEGCLADEECVAGECAEKPDFTVESISIEDPEPCDNLVDVKVVFKNNGGSKEGVNAVMTASALCKTTQDGNEITTTCEEVLESTVEDTQAGEEYEILFEDLDITDTDTTDGVEPLNVTAVADDWGSVGESNENNNTLEESIDLRQDFYISSFEVYENPDWEPTSASGRYLVDVTVNVSGPAYSYFSDPEPEVEIYTNGASTGNADVENLCPAGNSSQTVTVSTSNSEWSDGGENEVRAVVDKSDPQAAPFGRIEETNEENNELVKTVTVGKINDCGTDFECFMTNVGSHENVKCLFTSTVNLFGILQTTTNYMENKNIVFHEEYEFYVRVEEVSVEFSEDLVQTYLDQGLSQEEIDQLEGDANEQAQGSVGAETTCRYTDASPFITVLNNWNQGNFSTDDYDFCTELTTG